MHGVEIEVPSPPHHDVAAVDRPLEDRPRMPLRGHILPSEAGRREQRNAPSECRLPQDWRNPIWGGAFLAAYIPSPKGREACALRPSLPSTSARGTAAPPTSSRD